MASQALASLLGLLLALPFADTRYATLTDAAPSGGVAPLSLTTAADLDAARETLERKLKAAQVDVESLLEVRIGTATEEMGLAGKAMRSRLGQLTQNLGELLMPLDIEQRRQSVAVHHGSRGKCCCRGETSAAPPGELRCNWRSEGLLPAVSKSCPETERPYATVAGQYYGDGSHALDSALDMCAASSGWKAQGESLGL